MADNDTPTPTTNADLTPPPATTEFQPAAPLKNAGVGFDAEGGTLENGGGTTNLSVQGLKDGAQRLTAQAGDKARSFAEQGKDRAGDALDELSRMLNDAAGQVDEKLGDQYGQYARSAASTVSGFADQIRSKDIDQLVDDARELVRKSPAIAVGTAAALGFVLARVISSGLDQRDA